jgi:hypothetical protein
VFEPQHHKQVKKKITPIFTKIFQKIKVEGMLQNSFCKTSINLMPKPEDITRK